MTVEHLSATAAPVGSARDVMITAAERLVAEHGLSAMSLREVQSLAHQRNKSAAQYHFGSREGLIEAVVLTRMAAVNERRGELLDLIDARPIRRRGADVRALVEALVRPLAEQTILAAQSHWARFVLQCSSDPTVSAVVRRSVEGQAYREVHDRLTAAIDHVPQELRARRVDHAVGLVFMSLAGAEARRDAGEAVTVGAAAHVEDLIDTCVALLGAPSSATTRRALDVHDT